MPVTDAAAGPFDRPDPDLPDWLDDDGGGDDTRDPGDAEPDQLDIPEGARLGPEEGPDDDDTRDPGEGEVPLDLSAPFLTAGLDFESGEDER